MINCAKKKKQTWWSKKIFEERIRFFGHIYRLPQNNPARLALSKTLRPTKRPKSKPQTTHLSIDKNITTNESFSTE